MDGEKCVGTIVCKLERHKSKTYRGYIAMLAVDPTYRKRRIGTTLVEKVSDVTTPTPPNHLFFVNLRILRGCTDLP